MRSKITPRSWRLLELAPRHRRPCPHCGETHQYLTHTTRGGDCFPILFPPGFSTPVAQGIEVEAFVAGSADREESSAYQQLAERVKTTTIRCEGCGERFDDLEQYRQHACEVQYR